MIANRMKMIDDGDGSPQRQQQDNALDTKKTTEARKNPNPGNPNPGNAELRGAALTIQRALRAKKEAEGHKRTFNLADISKAAVKVEGKRKP